MSTDHLPVDWRRQPTTNPDHSARFSTDDGALSVTIDNYAMGQSPSVTCAVFDKTELAVKTLTAGDGCGLEITTNHTSIMLVLPCTMEQLAGMIFADLFEGTS